MRILSFLQINMPEKNKLDKFLLANNRKTPALF